MSSLSRFLAVLNLQEQTFPYHSRPQVIREENKKGKATFLESVSKSTLKKRLRQSSLLLSFFRCPLA